MNNHEDWCFGNGMLQDSAMAMKALVEYTVRQRIRDVSSLSVTVEATSLQGHVRNLYVNEKNLAQLQRIEVRMEYSMWYSVCQNHRYFHCGLCFSFLTACDFLSVR